MSSGAIEAISRSWVESRRDVRVPTAWVEEPTFPVSWPSGVWLGNAPSREWEPKGDVVLVFSGDNDWGRAVARAQAELGGRVYVLVGQKGAARESDEEMMRSGCVLLRRIAAVPGTAVYVGGGARVDLGAGFALTLDSGPAAALRALFLWLFWHEATDEGFVERGVVRWRAPGERSFDVRKPGSSSPVRFGDGRIPLRGLAGGPRGGEDDEGGETRGDGREESMSAYISYPTPMTDRGCLVAALADVGFDASKVEAHDSPVPLVGYEGGERREVGEVVI